MPRLLRRKVLLGTARRRGVAVTTFPSITTLDTFNRAGSSDLGANWTVDPASAGYTSPGIVNNWLAGSDLAATDMVAWVDPFGPNVAMGITMTFPPDSDGSYSMALFGRQSGASYYAAMWDWGLSSGDLESVITLTFKRGATTITSAALPDVTPPAIGWKFGFTIEGSTLRAWLARDGSTWAVVGTATDANLASAGGAGILLYDENNETRWDNWGAVTL